MPASEFETTIQICDLRCWMAVEDVCRCRCSGANHGIVRGGGERPGRTKRKGERYYKLVAVGSPKQANRIERDDYYGWLKEIGYQNAKEKGHYPQERILVNKARKAQLKWDEVQAGKNEITRYNGTILDQTYLVWEREDTPAFWSPIERDEIGRVIGIAAPAKDDGGIDGAI